MLGKVFLEGRRVGFLGFGEFGLGKREGFRCVYNYCISLCDIIVFKFSNVKCKRFLLNCFFYCDIYFSWG